MASVGGAAGYRVRRAGIDDIETILALRRLMFVEMGVTDEEGLEQMACHARRYMLEALPAGEMLAWVAEDASGQVAACGAAVVHISPPSVVNLVGKEAYVMNICTFPPHRRRGLARRIVETIVEWARAEGIPSVTLRASEQGRPLYVSMGFMPLSQMRLGVLPPDGRPQTE